MNFKSRPISVVLTALALTIPKIASADPAAPKVPTPKKPMIAVRANVTPPAPPPFKVTGSPVFLPDGFEIIPTNYGVYLCNPDHLDQPLQIVAVPNSDASIPAGVGYLADKDRLSVMETGGTGLMFDVKGADSPNPILVETNYSSLPHPKPLPMPMP